MTQARMAAHFRQLCLELAKDRVGVVSSCPSTAWSEGDDEWSSDLENWTVRTAKYQEATIVHFDQHGYETLLILGVEGHHPTAQRIRDTWNAIIS